MGMDSYLFRAEVEDKEHGNHLLYLRRSTIVHNWMENNLGYNYAKDDEVTVTEDQLRALETYLLQYLVGHRVWDCRVDGINDHGLLRCWHVYEIRDTIAAIWAALDPEPDHDTDLFVYLAN